MNFNTFVNSLDRQLAPPVKTHLKHVYSTLTMSVLSATIGSYVHLNTNLDQYIGGLLNFLVMSGLLFAIYTTPDNGKNHLNRLGYLLGFAFFSGFGLGPLIELTLYVKPTILPTAFFSTAILFACFTLSSIYGDRRKALFLGGTLMSGLSLLLFMSVLNLFFNSILISKAYIYLAFFVMCGFVIYDTSLIIEKRIAGDTDYISHAILLFMDFISIFRHLLVILTEKERQNNKKKRN